MNNPATTVVRSRMPSDEELEQHRPLLERQDKYVRIAERLWADGVMIEIYCQPLDAKQVGYAFRNCAGPVFIVTPRCIARLGLNPNTAVCGHYVELD